VLPVLAAGLGGAAVSHDEVLAVASTLVALIGAAATWNVMRRRMIRAQRLAAQHPELQAARAWRGEPAVRDPYRI
jgi:hypothetical protein